MNPDDELRDEDILDALEETRREAEELAREAGASPSVPGEDRLVASFAETMAAGPAGGAPRRSSHRVLLGLVGVAAAAILLVLFTTGTEDGGGTGDRGTLGGGGIECIAPRGSASTFARFEWRAADGAETYDLEIRDLRGDVILERKGIGTTTWTPTAVEADAMPDEILWRVVARDPTSAVLAFGDAQASRSR